MFEEDRIKTYLFDSSDESECKKYLYDKQFDIIIDDGNHDPEYQVKTLKNLFPLLKKDGIYVIEDIGGYSGDRELMVDYKEDFENIVGGCTVVNRGNHIIIVGDKKIEKKDLSNMDIFGYIGKHIGDISGVRS